MLENNLDPDVAEKPEELIVYGGTGKAARNWECFDAIVATLKRLRGDETLLVQSGKPVGVFPTHADAPRVLIGNSLLVPAWATGQEFRRLEAMGLTMFGQMTAGSWIYIGTQGIVQGTFETFAAAAQREFGQDHLEGRLVVTAGLGGMGGAQPLAATMNGATALIAEVDPERIDRRIQTRYLDRREDGLDRAIDQALEARDARRAVSIGVRVNAVDLLERLIARDILPDLITDQTSAHDELAGYVPRGAPDEDLALLRRRDPETYVKRSYATMAAHVRALLELQRRGAVVFDYGNNLRGQALKGGVDDAFKIGGFVPLYIRPLFCEGKGPFRWAALSGDPEDIRATDRALMELFPENRQLVALADPRAGPCRLPGAAGPDLLARLWRARPRRAPVQPHGARGQGPRADRHRPRPSGRRVRGLAQPGDRGHAGRIRRDRGLAHLERAPEHRVRSHVGLGAPRRRRGHRVFDPRGHGRSWRTAPPEADRRLAPGAPSGSGNGSHAPRGRRLPGGDRRRAGTRGGPAVPAVRAGRPMSARRG